MKELFNTVWQHPIYLLWGWLVLIIIAEFIVMGTDKLLAKAQKRRVPEVTLFLLALIGGSVGALLGMILFRHKTKHRSFVIGMPAIFILHLVIAGLILFK